MQRSLKANTVWDYSRMTIWQKSFRFLQTCTYYKTPSSFQIVFIFTVISLNKNICTGYYNSVVTYMNVSIQYAKSAQNDRIWPTKMPPIPVICNT